MSYNDHEVVDDNIFSQLLDMDDDNGSFEFTRMILTDFFQQMDESMDLFERYMSQQNYDEVGKLGHKLKGSAGQVGANRVKLICDDIQHYRLKAPNGQEGDYLRHLIDQLPTSAEEARLALFKRIGD